VAQGDAISRGGWLPVLVPDMRGFGDSDKPAGNEGYDGRALAEELRALRQQVGFGAGRPANSRRTRHGRAAGVALGGRSPG
jgi:pimeloyl-ACP methyl ester carboxylesterase